jgi:CRISPR-associated endoribonuclease Cas6
MLLSSLISLTVLNDYPVPGPLSRPVQAWFLGQLEDLNILIKKLISKNLVDLEEKDLALKIIQLIESLHKEEKSKGLKIRPYTISTLLRDTGWPVFEDEKLRHGESYWIRITSLDTLLSKLVLFWVLPIVPDLKALFPITSRRMLKIKEFRLSQKKYTIRLYQINCRIDGYTLNPREHPWAGQTSFSEIAQDSRYAKVSHETRMEFVSPTAFRSNGNDIALPAPGQIFRSLSQKWNAFCSDSMQLQDFWSEFAEDCILVNEMTSVNTVHWEFAEGTRGAATGFTGTVGFTLLPKAKVKEKWQPYWDGADVVMQSLARFAFYCGVGHHSTIGMGQSRMLTGQKSTSASNAKLTTRK